MSGIEKRQRLTRTGKGHPKVHAARYEQRATGSRYVTLCGQHLHVQQSRQAWGAITCTVCALRVRSQLPDSQIPTQS